MKINHQKINLTLRPSRYLFTFISGLHLLVLILASLSGVEVWYMVVVFITLALSYYYLIKRYIYRLSRYSVINLWQDEQSCDPSRWQLMFSNKEVLTSTLEPKGYASNFLIIMHFRIGKKWIFPNLLKNYQYKIIPVIITPDMIDIQDYHKLTLYLTGY